MTTTPALSKREAYLLLLADLKQGLSREGKCELTSEQLESFTSYKDVSMNELIIRNPNTSSDTLLMLAESDDVSRFLKSLIPLNRNAPFKVLELLMQTRSHRYVASHHLCTPKMLKELAMSEKNAVRALVAENPNTSKTVLSILSTDSKDAVRYGVAGNPSTYKKDLERLSKDDCREVLESLAMRDDNPEVMRKRLCKKLSKHVPATCFCPDGFYSHSGM